MGLEDPQKNQPDNPRRLRWRPSRTDERAPFDLRRIESRFIMSDRKLRLLVVDDDPNTLATYARILALEGYHVATAGDGAIGLSLLRSETFELVLTDHRMPKVTGLELLAESAALPHKPPIAMYTAMGSPALEAAARSLGAVEYSDGLWDVDGLTRVVRRLLTQRQPNRTNSDSHSDPRLLRAIKFIRRGFRSQKMSLGRTAAVAGVSSWQLSRMLQKTTGATFTIHVRRARIDAAERLLAPHRLPLKQIAEAVGYVNDRELRRDFRHIYGISPSQYRSRLATENGNKS